MVALPCGTSSSTKRQERRTTSCDGLHLPLGCNGTAALNFRCLAAFLGLTEKVHPCSFPPTATVKTQPSASLPSPSPLLFPPPLTTTTSPFSPLASPHPSSSSPFLNYLFTSSPSSSPPLPVYPRAKRSSCRDNPATRALPCRRLPPARTSILSLAMASTEKLSPPTSAATLATTPWCGPATMRFVELESRHQPLCVRQ